MPVIRIAVLTGSTLLLVFEPARAAAASCAERPVSARGDPSRLELLAKANARGNWRAKVRAMPTLGAPYANFNKAIGADYRCSLEGGRHVCVAVAHPCRD